MADWFCKTDYKITQETLDYLKLFTKPLITTTPASNSSTMFSNLLDKRDRIKEKEEVYLAELVRTPTNEGATRAGTFFCS